MKTDKTFRLAFSAMVFLFATAGFAGVYVTENCESAGCVFGEGGRWLAQSTSNTGFKWIDLAGEKPVEALRCFGYNKAGLNDGCIAFRGDRVLRMMDGGYALFAPGEKQVAEGVNWPVVKFSNRSYIVPAGYQGLLVEKKFKEQ